ncbi:MAG: hypothetical protein ACXAB7_17065 [Candidatus Kariarchaeaceae archaeon]
MTNQPKMGQDTLETFDSKSFEFVDLSTMTRALTAKSRDEDGIIRFGVPKDRLLLVLGVSEYKIEVLLEKYSEVVSPLGLEIIEYKDAETTWLTVRQNLFAPMDLAKPSQALLGFIIAKCYREKPDYVTVEDFRNELVKRGFMTNAEYTNSLVELVEKRYLGRKRGRITLDIRCFLEFSEEDILTIKKESMIILGNGE